MLCSVQIPEFPDGRIFIISDAVRLKDFVKPCVESAARSGRGKTNGFSLISPSHAIGSHLCRGIPSCHFYSSFRAQKHLYKGDFYEGGILESDQRPLKSVKRPLLSPWALDQTHSLAFLPVAYSSSKFTGHDPVSH